MITIPDFYKSYKNLFPLFGGSHPYDWPELKYSVDQLMECGCDQFGWVVPPDHMVVDVDPRNGGDASYIRLCSDLGIDIDRTCSHVVRTGGGGTHYYFSFPAHLDSVMKLGSYDGIDMIRSQPGGRAHYVVGAGSLPLASKGQTQQYELVKSNPFFALMPLPPQLVDLVTTERKPTGLVEVKPLRGSLGDIYSSQLDGVEDLMDQMTEHGYTFRNAGDRYEWDRPGKTTGSSRSGHLGHVSENGRYQLTCFSTEDEFFPHVDESPSITIYEALTRLLNGGETGTKEAYQRSLAYLEAKGWKSGQIQEVVVATAEGGGASDAPLSSLANYRIVEDVKIGLSMAELLEPWLSAGWPKSCAGELFVPYKGKIRSMPQVNDLFAWMSTNFRLHWAEHEGCVKRGEFFGEMRKAAEWYSTIEATPHFPPRPDRYYMNAHLSEPGDAADFWAYVDMFHPETPLDRQLIASAMLTPLWGGPGGQRPLFLVTSEDGIGAGKSSLVKAIARVASLGSASVYQIRRAKHFDELEKNIGATNPLSPVTNRIIAIDNFKGATLGAADIESMITEERLNVWKLYQGGVELDNLFTWFVTGNYISMTPDLASRTVEIRINKPIYSAAWEDRMQEWDLSKVVRGAAAVMASSPVIVGSPNRFASWCREILARVTPTPDAAIPVLAQRGSELSHADEVIEEVTEWLDAYVASRGDSAVKINGKTFIRPPELAQWLNDTNRPCHYAKGKWNAIGVGRMLAQCVTGVVTLERYRKNHTKGWLY